MTQPSPRAGENGWNNRMLLTPAKPVGIQQPRLVLDGGLTFLQMNGGCTDWRLCRTDLCGVILPVGSGVCLTGHLLTPVSSLFCNNGGCCNARARVSGYQDEHEQSTELSGVHLRDTTATASAEAVETCTGVQGSASNGEHEDLTKVRKDFGTPPMLGRTPMVGQKRRWSDDSDSDSVDLTMVFPPVISTGTSENSPEASQLPGIIGSSSQTLSSSFSSPLSRPQCATPAAYHRQLPSILDGDDSRAVLMSGASKIIRVD